MPEKNSISNENDEIDLSKIFTKINGGFIKLKNKIIFIDKTIQKRWILICFFIALGTGSGVFIYYSMRPTYSSSLSINSNFLNNDLCLDLVTTLTSLAKDSPQNLAQGLKLSEEDASEIVSIKYKDFSTKLSKRRVDSLNISSPFKIEAKVYNTKILDTLQSKLIDYLENNSYTLKRKKVRQATLTLLSRKVKDELCQLDSLKVIINKSILPKGSITGITIGQPIDPIIVHNSAISLYERELNINEQIQLSDNIEVIEGFTKYSKPSSPGLVVNLFALGAGGFLFGLFIALRLERKKVN